MGLASDLKILYHLAFAKPSGGDHGARLEAFYKAQAPAYDDFRRRLLHGREQMMRALDVPPGGRLLDMGGGTGSNFEALGGGAEQLGLMRIVDLSPSLLAVAEDRFRRHGWAHAETVVADATTYEPPDGPVDIVTFSYSLTMIPDWFKAIDQAYRNLKPGGQVGVADFYVSRKWPAPGRVRHPAPRRLGWPAWFANDNVFPSPDHLPYLESRFQTVTVAEGLGTVPYLLGLKAPYYVFVGRKPA